MTVITQLLSAFAGSLGFALLFNVRGRRVLPAAFGGLLAWGIYLLMGLFGAGEIVSYIAASVAMSLYSEIMAHATKAPATVYLVSAAIPLVPGGMLYSTMQAAIAQNWDAFFHGTLRTLMLAMSIAGGILVAMTMFSIIKRILGAAAEKRARAHRAEEAGKTNR